MTRRIAIIFLISAVVLFLLAGVGFFFGRGFINEAPTLFPQSGAERKKEPVFRPEDLDWREITAVAPWQARDSHAAAVFKDKIWLIGGLNADAAVKGPGEVAYERAEYFNDVWYSEDGSTWTRAVEHAPWPARRSQQIAVFQGKMWLVGGWGPRGGYAKELWTSEDGIEWQKVIPEDGPPEIEGHQLVVFKDYLWLFGGVRYTDRKLVNEVWRTVDGVHWERVIKNAPWHPRWDQTVSAFNGALWLIGGMDLAGNEFNDVWRSEDGIEWEQVAEHAAFSTRQGHAALVYKNYLWIIGQLNDTPEKGINDVWSSADGSTWKKTAHDPAWLGREDGEAVVFKDAIWVLGGMTSEWKWSGEIWKSDFPQ